MEPEGLEVHCWNIWCLQSCMCEIMFSAIFCSDYKQNLCCIMLYSILLYLCACKISLHLPFDFYLLFYSYCYHLYLPVHCKIIIYPLLVLSQMRFYSDILVIVGISPSSFIYEIYLAFKIIIGISSFSFEIMDELPCYIRKWYFCINFILSV